MKDIIFYHRAYRRASIAGKYIFLEFLLLTLPLSIATLFLYPEITFFMNRFARSVLLSSFSSADMEMLVKPYIFGNIYILRLHGKYPSPLLSFLLFLFSLFCIFFIPKSRISKPLAAWLIFISSIDLISSVLFMLVPSIFPYNIENFSELYVKTEISMWLFVPIVMGIALLLSPSNILCMFPIVTITLLYSVIFSIVRYTVFLYVLKQFSYIFMPLLFFAFGPLMDFTYIVGIYSLYISIIARKKNKRTEIGYWQWL